jgi:hypothetical protein
MIVKTQIHILKQNTIDQIQQIIIKIIIRKTITEIVLNIITIKVKNKLFVFVADNLGILPQIALIIIMVVVVEVYKIELMIFYRWEDKISTRKKIIKLKVQMGKMERKFVNNAVFREDIQEGHNAQLLLGIENQNNDFNQYFIF